MVIGEKTVKETTIDYHSKHWPDENETILEHFLLKDLSRLRFQLRFIVTIKQTDSIYWVVTRESRLLVYKHLCSITVVRKDSVLNAFIGEMLKQEFHGR